MSTDAGPVSIHAPGSVWSGALPRPGPREGSGSGKCNLCINGPLRKGGAVTIGMEAGERGGRGAERGAQAVEKQPVKRGRGGPESCYFASQMAKLNRGPRWRTGHNVLMIWKKRPFVGAADSFRKMSAENS